MGIKMSEEMILDLEEEEKLYPPDKNTRGSISEIEELSSVSSRVSKSDVTINGEDLNKR